MFSTFDATDGKQARRTDNCSPLGQILDHSVDSIVNQLNLIFTCAMLQVGWKPVMIFLHSPGFSQHYIIEVSSHFTDFYN